MTIIGWSFPSELRAWRARIGQLVTGDTDRDGDVDISNLSRLLASFGTQNGASGDDGDTDADGEGVRRWSTPPGRKVVKR